MEALFIRENRAYVRVNFRDLILIESAGSYLKIVTTAKTHLILNTMRTLESKLPGDQFCRIHRKYIIGLRYVQAFDRSSVRLLDRGNTLSLPIGQYTYRDALMNSFITIGNTGTDVPRLQLSELMEE